MSKRPVPKFGLAIDWETSGYSAPAPGVEYSSLHQGISFGAAIFDFKSLEPVDIIYREVQFDASRYKWDLGAERVHGLSREHLDVHGVSQQAAATELCNMVIKYFGTEKVPILGHRVYFDESFTNQLTRSIDIQLEFDPIRLDSAAVALLFLGVTSSDELFEAVNLPPRTEHNALEDILYTLHSIKMIRDRTVAKI